MGRFFRALLRRIVRATKRLFLIGKYLVLTLTSGVADDVELIRTNLKIVLGSMLTVVGALSFASDRYCDGNTSSYYACTRPATYYYYPWWAVLLVVIGVTLIVLWFLRRTRHS